MRQTPLFLENLHDLRDAEAVTIPVEHIGAPVLLLAYGDVGHPIPYAYLPLAGDRAHAPFMAQAQADAWPRVLAFLGAALNL